MYSLNNYQNSFCLWTFASSNFHRLLFPTSLSVIHVPAPNNVDFQAARSELEQVLESQRSLVDLCAQAFRNEAPKWDFQVALNGFFFGVVVGGTVATYVFFLVGRSRRAPDPTPAAPRRQPVLTDAPAATVA